ncbi:MAG TPA: hypothetical protein VD997_14530 [Phycisphaerales bacterium]|nr:hypothetical protein [Phycisphaerales bacterium]
MWSAIRNGALVFLVTAIIWFFAEAESLRSAVVRSVEVSFEPEAGSKYVVGLSQDTPGVRGTSVRADMIIEGPAAALEPMERTLRQPIVVSPGMDGLSVDPGRHTVDLGAVLANHPKLRGRGVTFRSLSPETVEATVDELVTRTVKVTVEVPGAELESSPEFKVTSAQVTLPSAHAGKINESTAVIARVEPAALTRLTPGRKEAVTGVRLLAPPELAGVPRLKIDPATIDVTLTLRSKTSTIRVASVPVHVRIAPGELNKWEIEIPEQDRFLTDVTVTGPGDLIKQIQDKALPVVATVHLSFEELERGIPSKEAVFSEYQTGLRFDVADRTVRLKIKRREAPAPTTPR